MNPYTLIAGLLTLATAVSGVLVGAKVVPWPVVAVAGVLAGGWWLLGRQLLPEAHAAHEQGRRIDRDQRDADRANRREARSARQASPNAVGTDAERPRHALAWMFTLITVLTAIIVGSAGMPEWLVAVPAVCTGFAWAFGDRIRR